jgi:hypothetical protein
MELVSLTVSDLERITNELIRNITIEEQTVVNNIDARLAKLDLLPEEDRHRLHTVRMTLLHARNTIHKTAQKTVAEMRDVLAHLVHDETKPTTLH